MLCMDSYTVLTQKYSFHFTACPTAILFPRAQKLRMCKSSNLSHHQEKKFYQTALQTFL
jgi:hypothetical protein